ncbi:synaptonemal complex protein 1 isoform X2 [Antennarius striatus]
MERDRSFNFKLLVPPRLNYGQVSAVLPQENLENSDFINKSQQAYTKHFDKEQNVPIYSTGMVAPTKPIRQELPKMKVVPPLEKEENNCNPGQLYSKLFDEVEKIKCWKAQADCDTAQKDKRLQENKRTIENLRKAFQELQFGNESLSIKLEEQINENEELRSKNNATRNLCNILKDTFERSTEKMHIFESEREETHHLFMEYNRSIHKLTAAFDSLYIQAEADQKEMEKVKEELLHFEGLKEKYHKEYNIKEKEVEVLQTKLGDKESELQKILLDLQETQNHYKLLQEASHEQYELLMSSKAQQESLLQELHSAEQHCKDTEKNRDSVATILEESKKEFAEKIQSKDLKLEELSKIRNQQAEKLEQIQTTILELQNSLTLEIQRTKELDDKLVANNTELEKRNTLFGETVEQSAKKDEQIKTLQEELDEKLKSIDSMKAKISVTDVRVEELTVELSGKMQEAEQFRNKAEVTFAENNLLKEAHEAAERTQEDLKIEVQELEGQLFTEKKRNEECIFKMEQLRNEVTQHEVKYRELLSHLDELQREKTAVQEQLQSRSSQVKIIEADIQESEEKVGKLAREMQILEEENQCLREAVNCMKANTHGEYLICETLQKKIEDSFDCLQQELTEKEKQIKAVAKKMSNLRKQIEGKISALEKYRRENEGLKKQVAREVAKSSQREDVINSLQEEVEKLQRMNNEDEQRLRQDLESTSVLSAEVEMLRLAAAEAIKNREDAEVKCQHKIADMVALMEKHKSQYDRMVEEKAAELQEKNRKEMEAASQMKSMELDLEKHKLHGDNLKQQLEIEVAQKERLQTELTDLKRELSSVKITQLPGITSKQSPASNSEKQRCSETPKENSLRSHVFDFTNSWKTPSYNNNGGITGRKRTTEFDCESIRTSRGTTRKTKKIHNEDPKTLKISDAGTSKIKSYIVTTPPDQEVCLELDPKLDSSDHSDMSKIASRPPSKVNILQKSTVSLKSPGNSLKQAAIKRMRDAGWTAVLSADRKRKAKEKIFV